MRKYLILFISLSLFVFSCNENSSFDNPDSVQNDKSINGGYSEPGEPGVVYISHDWGFACTGTLVAPNVVITAKHCVLDTEGNYGDFPLYGFHIGIGSDMWSLSGNYGVDKIFVYDHTKNIEDQDIAILVLSDDIPSSVATPYEYTLTTTGENYMVPQTTLLTLIGYGESVCGQQGNAGVKLRTEDTYMGFASGNDFATKGRGANHGDSGGPVFSPSMKLVGVISRGGEDCSGDYAGYTIATAVAKHTDIIKQAMEYAGRCGPTAYEEICGDGEDNNCDGHIDEACIAAGASCSEDWQCESNICIDQNGVKTCIESCDPNASTNTCGAGRYCQIIGCNQAVCAPGEVGPKGYYESCNSDLDCESLFCRTSADGSKKCLVPCEQGANQCFTDEVCYQTEDACGACIPASFVTSGKSLGETCTSPSQCESGHCEIWGATGFCSQNCTAQNECPDGFHCNGSVCVPGALGDLGATCDNDNDCLTGLSCIDFGNGFKHCASSCNPGDSCGKDGYACLPVSDGNWCKLSGGGALGDQCGNGKNCAPGLFCKETADNDFRCVSICNHDNPMICPSYTGCMIVEDDKSYCVPFDSVPKSSGGGSDGGCVSGGTKAGSDFLTVLSLFALFLFIRRKH